MLLPLAAGFIRSPKLCRRSRPLAPPAYAERHPCLRRSLHAFFSFRPPPIGSRVCGLFYNAAVVLLAKEKLWGKGRKTGRTFRLDFRNNVPSFPNTKKKENELKKKRGHTNGHMRRASSRYATPGEGGQTPACLATRDVIGYHSSKLQQHPLATGLSLQVANYLGSRGVTWQE